MPWWVTSTLGQVGSGMGHAIIGQPQRSWLLSRSDPIFGDELGHAERCRFKCLATLAKAGKQDEREDRRDAW
jgi:hypothetical protein